MTDSPVSLHASGPPETVLDPEPPEARTGLAEALQLPSELQRGAIAEVVARFPRCLEAWAALGEHGRDDVERYAAFRVGYHRGLDRLRASGWRGSGYVRWEHEENRGFLRSVHGLSTTAGHIGEHDEEERCAVFLRQLDPTWPPPVLR